MPPLFVCSKADGLDAAWVNVGGELDLATAPQLAQTLRECQSRASLVMLDLRGVSFMDSSGVHVIVDATVRARLGGKRLVLLRGLPNVDRLFALTGNVDLLEIVDADPLDPPAEALHRIAAE